MTNNRLRRLLLSLLAAMMIISAMPLTVLATYGDPVSADRWYDGEWYHYPGDGKTINDVSDFVGNNMRGVNIRDKNKQAIIENIIITYGSNDKRYKGKGQCYGYAEMIRKMFGTSYTKRNINKKATYKNLMKYLKNCKPGTHVRFSWPGGGYHSMVILSVNKKFVWYTDGNVDYKNGIRLGIDRTDDFMYWSSRFSKLLWVMEPKGKVPTVSKLTPKAEGDIIGPKTIIAWRPVKGAKSYIVYRSNSKTNGYKAIATVKKARYVDKNASLSGKVYYKVKAVKSNKKGVMSKPTAVVRSLAPPKVVLREVTDAAQPTYTLSWKAVPGASKYNVYYMKEGAAKYTKKVVTGTTWTYSERDLSIVHVMVSAQGKKAASESLRACIGYNLETNKRASGIDY